MSTIKDLPTRSVTEMSDAELLEYLRQIRHSRRTPKASTTKRQVKKAKESKPFVPPDPSTMSKELISQLLSELEDSDET